MPAVSASAPGKVILFGEHAVVYGQPAIAVPVQQVQAKAIVTPLVKPGAKVRIEASQVGVDADLDRLSSNDPLAAAVRGALQALHISKPPAFKLKVTSAIPLAAGLGSGAAVSVAILRAVSDFLGKPFTEEETSSLAFEVEKLHHGTPSGIDNTVVTYNKPVYFTKDKPIETFAVRMPFTLLIADTGVPSPTRVAVGDVRAAWQADPAQFEALFAKVGDLVKKARAAIEKGESEQLGPLMHENHALLREMTVSSAELDVLVAAAEDAGAFGAKLSGGGRGGNMIALVNDKTSADIEAALTKAGAKTIIKTVVK
jgi:mevalonate kinase